MNAAQVLTLEEIKGRLAAALAGTMPLRETASWTLEAVEFLLDDKEGKP